MKNVLEEAIETVKQRQDSYDDPYRNHVRIAKLWSVVLGTAVTPQQVALCMLQLKVAREMYKHSHDNVVDMAGYVNCLDLINKAEKPEWTPEKYRESQFREKRLADNFQPMKYQQYDPQMRYTEPKDENIDEVHPV